MTNNSRVVLGYHLRSYQHHPRSSPTSSVPFACVVMFRDRDRLIDLRTISRVHCIPSMSFAKVNMISRVCDVIVWTPKLDAGGLRVWNIIVSAYFCVCTVVESVSTWSHRLLMTAMLLQRFLSDHRINLGHAWGCRMVVLHCAATHVYYRRLEHHLASLRVLHISL